MRVQELWQGKAYVPTSIRSSERRRLVSRASCYQLPSLCLYMELWGW